MGQLEAFAQHADEVLNVIEMAFSEFGRVQDVVFKQLKAVDLHVELPSRTMLDTRPCALVDQLSEFARALDVSGDWLDKQKGRFEAFDNWKLEVQRIVHFGLLACKLANGIRGDLALRDSGYVIAWQRNFEAVFGKLQREYERDPTGYPLLSEFEARLTSVSRSIAGR
ncbi:hypothetical protein [Burkholderia cepacia]|uniref:hypothetical protein n=1 Tax=Burkholderia cepacia TaxID=292 RepID=UPI002AB63F2C|nr:hypothetical protein [Burkholderia cepacia]